jgi:hypothetical protein
VYQPQGEGRDTQWRKWGGGEGLPLWKINCETTDDGSYLTWVNAGPLAADDARVYATKKDKVIAVDAATGQIVYTCPNKFPASRILLSEGLLVCSCWQERDFSRAAWDSFDKPKDTEKEKPRPSLWSSWIAKGGAGTVEAYEAASGKPKWTLPFAAEMMVAADLRGHCHRRRAHLRLAPGWLACLLWEMRGSVAAQPVLRAAWPPVAVRPSPPPAGPSARGRANGNTLPLLIERGDTASVCPLLRIGY